MAFKFNPLLWTGCLASLAARRAKRATLVLLPRNDNFKNMRCKKQVGEGSVAWSARHVYSRQTCLCHVQTTDQVSQAGSGPGTL